MAKLDRYILSQLTGPFALFALILIGIYWIGRAVGLFDELIGDGQPIATFAGFMILFLPQVVAIILPVVAFSATLFVANRLHVDSEMVVFQAAGISPMRLLLPYVIFGLMVAILAGALSHYLVPISYVQLDERRRAMSRDVAARLIVGGRFLHPSENVTFFVRDVRNDGSLIDIFLHDQRPRGRDITYTARKAILFRHGDDARLVMFDGVIQTLDEKRLLLSTIQFDEFVLDIGSLARNGASPRRSISEYSTLEALFPTARMIADSGQSASAFRIEANKRIEQPLQSFIYPLIAVATLMLGGFSRFGVTRQVFAAVGVVVALATVAVPLRNLAIGDIAYWWLFYVPDLLGLGIVAALIWLSMRRRSRARATPPTGNDPAGTGGTPPQEVST